MRLYVEAKNEIDVELLADKILNEIKTNYFDYDPATAAAASSGSCNCNIF